MNHWLRGTSYIAYQAPDTPNEPDHTPAQGDPHGDEVLENGPDTPEPEVPETPEPESLEAPGTTPAPDTPTHKPDWRDKELGRRKRRVDEESARATAAEARAKAAEDLVVSLARQPPAETPEGQQPPPERRQPQERVYTQAELDAEADRRAEIKANNQTFQRDFDSAIQAANKSYGKDKVNEAIARISELGGLDVDHLNLVLATDDPGKVIFDLGSKPEEFQRIMDLPYARRAVEFTKMGLKSETPARRPSGAPPPVEPIGGSGGNSDNRYNDKADDAAWFAAEEKRSAAAWKKKNEGWRG